MMIFLFGGSMLIIWPILLPVNAVNQRGDADGISGMDLLSISNIKDPNRYWAHTFVAIAFVGILVPCDYPDSSCDMLVNVP